MSWKCFQIMRLQFTLLRYYRVGVKLNFSFINRVFIAIAVVIQKQKQGTLLHIPLARDVLEISRNKQSDKISKIDFLNISTVNTSICI